MIGLVWAQARNRAGRPVVGANGGIPWHVPEDLAHFSELTRGGTVLMGRGTWTSLPRRFRPLPGRTNIIVTSSRDEVIVEAGQGKAGRASQMIHGSALTLAVPSLAEGITVAQSLSAGVPGHGAPHVWVIGGPRMWGEALGVADRVVLTEIDLSVEGDTFAPILDGSWTAPPRPWTASSTGVRFRILDYTRTEPSDEKRSGCSGAPQ